MRPLSLECSRLVTTFEKVAHFSMKKLKWTNDAGNDWLADGNIMITNIILKYELNGNCGQIICMKSLNGP